MDECWSICFLDVRRLRGEQKGSVRGSQVLMRRV